MRGEGVDSARYYFTEAIRIYTEIGDEVWEANALALLGESYCSSLDFRQSLDKLNESVRLHIKNGSITSLAVTYFCRAGTYGAMSLFAKAIDDYLSAVRLSERSGNDLLMASAINNIGWIYTSMGNNRQALTYFYRSIPIIKSIGWNDGLVGSYVEMGTANLKLGAPDSAAIYYNMALELALKDHNTTRTAEVYGLMGILYTEQKKYTDAYEYLEKAATLNKELNLVGSYANNLVAMANTISNAGNDALATMHIPPAQKHTRAIHILEEALQIGMASGEQDIKQKALEALSHQYEELNEPAKALAYYKRYTSVKDSILNTTNAASVNNLQLQYETENKEREISLLKSQHQVERLSAARRKGINYGLGGALLGTMAVTLAFYRQSKKRRIINNALTVEKKKSDNLLLNILPLEVAEELKDKGSARAKYYESVTVMFTDFVSFTTAGERMPAQDLVDELDACFKAFDMIISKYNIEKIKTIGDAYLAVCGLPAGNERHAEQLVNAALEIRNFMLDRRQQLGDKTFEIRIGVHSGPVVAGIVGVKKFAYDIWGDTVNTAARMEQRSAPGKVNISQHTYDLAGNSFDCSFRGAIEAKNKGAMNMYFVNDPKPPATATESR